MATAQPIETFSSEADLGGPSGLCLSGNPSIEVGGFAPPNCIDGVPGGSRPRGLPNIGF